jgi:hypothetical protein
MTREWSANGMPTADDIALAIVLAAREYGEDPIEVASSGGSCCGAREAAFVSLECVFPLAPKPILARLVGAGPNFLATFRRGWGKPDRKKAYQIQVSITDAIYAQHSEARIIKPAPTVKAPMRLGMRRRAVVDCLDVTAHVMGDPAPGRSALAQRGKDG